MKPLIHAILSSFLVLAAGGAFATDALGEKDTAFLAHYETVRAALADDKLDAAQAAAKDLDGAAAITAAKSMGDARKAFRLISARAVALAQGRTGFFIAHCSMYPGGADWVQTTKEISNPYWGKSMLRCGEIVEPK